MLLSLAENVQQWQKTIQPTHDITYDDAIFYANIVFLKLYDVFYLSLVFTECSSSGVLFPSSSSR